MAQKKGPALLYLACRRPVPEPRAHVSVGREGGSDPPSHPLAPCGGAATCWRGMPVTLRDVQGRTVSPEGGCVFQGTLGHVWGHVAAPAQEVPSIWGEASVEHLQGPEHPLKMTQDRVPSAPRLIIWKAKSPSFGSCCRCDTSNLRDGVSFLWPQF